MFDNKRSITVDILDKQYQVKCEPSEVAALQQSALYLNQKMREIRHNSMLRHMETIAVMAALNITHDLLKLQAEQDQEVHSISKRVQQIQHKIEDVLEKQTEIEF